MSLAKALSPEGRFTAALVSVFASLLLAMPGLCGETDSPNLREKWLRQLDEIRGEIATVREELQGTDAALHRRRNEIVYDDPEARRLHAEIKQIEKRLIEARQALSERLDRMADIPELRDRRSELYRTLGDLTRREKELIGHLSTLVEVPPVLTNQQQRGDS